MSERIYPTYKSVNNIIHCLEKINDVHYMTCHHACGRIIDRYVNLLTKKDITCKNCLRNIERGRVS